MKTLSKLAILTVMALLVFNGCRKDVAPQSGTASTKKVYSAAAIPDSMALTPRGLMPKSHLHLVEAGYHLEVRNGHMTKIETATGVLKEDFGPVRHLNNSTSGAQQLNSNGRNASGGMDRSSRVQAPGSGNGWVTWAQAEVGSGQSITSFSTNWTVPANPCNTSDPQVVYIWEGTESSDNTTLIQPVLQWGTTTFLAGKNG